MMDCSTMEKNHQPKEEQEEDSSTVSLYIHVVSSSLNPDYLGDNFSVFYKIDSSSSEEANFSQKPKMIPEKKPKNLPQIGCGSAICDSILYLFGGWMDGESAESSPKACYLDLASSDNGKSSSSWFVPLEHEMNLSRVFPTTFTIGKKIYIFGSHSPGFGEFPSKIGTKKEKMKWAEVFDTEDKLFKLIRPPPPSFFEWHSLGVGALIEKDKILIATADLSDLFIYHVGSDLWTHTPRDTISPFRLYSMRSPVIGKYIFLYGGGKICAFDIDKKQFLKNDITLWEYIFFDHEGAMLHGDIHHLGGWKFCVVFDDDEGYWVRFVYVVSFEIENPERCGELNIKAGTINVVDHVIRGHAFIDSLLWSSPIVPSGNPNNGMRSLKSNLIVGGSSVMSHVHDDCMMDDDGAASMPDADSKFRRAKLSRLRRKKASMDKQLLEIRLQMDFLRLEINRLKDKLPKSLPVYDSYLAEYEMSERELSYTNRCECVENENVSEIKTECVRKELSSIYDKVEAQLKERLELALKIRRAINLVERSVRLINGNINVPEEARETATPMNVPEEEENDTLATPSHAAESSSQGSSRSGTARKWERPLDLFTSPIEVEKWSRSQVGVSKENVGPLPRRHNQGLCANPTFKKKSQKKLNEERRMTGLWVQRYHDVDPSISMEELLESPKYIPFSGSSNVGNKEAMRVVSNEKSVDSIDGTTSILNKSKEPRLPEGTKPMMNEQLFNASREQLRAENTINEELVTTKPKKDYKQIVERLIDSPDNVFCVAEFASIFGIRVEGANLKYLETIIQREKGFNLNFPPLSPALSA